MSHRVKPGLTGRAASFQPRYSARHAWLCGLTSTVRVTVCNTLWHTAWHIINSICVSYYCFFIIMWSHKLSVSVLAQSFYLLSICCHMTHSPPGEPHCDVSRLSLKRHMQKNGHLWMSHLASVQQRDTWVPTARGTDDTKPKTKDCVGRISGCVFALICRFPEPPHHPPF